MAVTGSASAGGRSAHEVAGEFILDDGTTVSGRFVTPAGLAVRLGVTVWDIRHHMAVGHIRVLRTVSGRYLIRPREATRVAKTYEPKRDWEKRHRSGPER